MAYFFRDICLVYMLSLSSVQLQLYPFINETDVLPTDRNESTIMLPPNNFPSPELLACLGLSDSSAPVDNVPALPKPKSLAEACTRCNINETECSCTEQPFICGFLESDPNQKIHQTLYVVRNDNKNELLFTKIRAIVQIIASIIAIVGNLLVIIVTLNYLKIETRCNKLIAVLALCDFIFAFEQILVSIPLLWTLTWEIGGEYSCKIIHNFASSSVCISVGFLFLISVERYLGIMHPHNNFLTTTKVVLLSILIVVVSICTNIPTSIYLHIDEQNYCWDKWPSVTAVTVYTWLDLIVYFILPVTIIAVMYIRIIRLLHASCDTSMLASEHQKLKRVKNNKHVMKILVCIIIAFIVLTLPNRLVWLIIYQSETKNQTALQKNVLTLIGFLPYSFHVAINPIIYSLLGKKFRERVKNMMSRKRTHSIVTAGLTIKNPMARDISQHSTTTTSAGNTDIKLKEIEQSKNVL